MRQSYKLRLGDGTVLMVDHAGLGNWLGDRKALVQPVGSELWKPLRDFLVQERGTAGGAARHRAPEESIPVRADGLPLIPLPPRPPDRSEAALRGLPPASPTAVARPSLPTSLPEPAVPPLLRKPAPPEAPAPPQAPRPPVPPRPPEERLAMRNSLAMTPPAPTPATLPATARSGDMATVPLKPPIHSAKPPALSPTPGEDRNEVASPPVRPASLEAPAERAVLQAPARELLTSAAKSPSATVPADEDTEWMTLPAPPGNEPPGLPAVSWLDSVKTPAASAPPTPASSAPPVLLREGPRPTRSRAPSPFETLLGPWTDRARRDWRATRLWLTSRGVSAYRAFVAFWKALSRRDRSVPSPSPDEPAASHAVHPDPSARLEPRPSAGAPPGVPVQAKKATVSLGVYRPRRSSFDGLPIFEPDPVEGDEGTDSFGGAGSPTSTDDLAEIILEPLDELPLQPVAKNRSSTTKSSSS